MVASRKSNHLIFLIPLCCVRYLKVSTVLTVHQLIFLWLTAVLSPFVIPPFTKLAVAVEVVAAEHIFVDPVDGGFSVSMHRVVSGGSNFSSVESDCSEHEEANMNSSVQPKRGTPSLFGSISCFLMEQIFLCPLGLHGCFSPH